MGTGNFWDASLWTFVPPTPRYKGFLCSGLIIPDTK